jgi:hypothetical protein
LRVTDSMKKATYIYSISREDYINSFFFWCSSQSCSYTNRCYTIIKLWYCLMKTKYI